VLTIAADPEHLGARIGIALRSWGHHPLTKLRPSLLEFDRNEQSLLICEAL
jgi:hypothetical protein